MAAEPADREEAAPSGGFSLERADRLQAVASEIAGPRAGLLAEAPALSDLLDLVGLTDRLVAMAVERLIDLAASGEVETVTGVNVERWLAAAGRRTSADVRMLLTAAELLPRLPGLRQAFSAGQVSWSQVRAVLCEIRRFPVSSLPTVDDHVCERLDHEPDADPDTIATGLGRLAWQLDELREARRLEAAESTAGSGEFFAMQPRLDGTGGRVWGELAAVGFATLDAALNHDLRMPAGGGTFDDGGDRAAQVRHAGRHRARRLIDWADHYLAGCPDRSDPREAASRPGTGRSAPPKVLVRAELDTLLGGRLPAELLTTLAGGRLHVTSATARRIIDAAGAEFRLVVLDDTGSVVGVGDRSRVPPGWVSDAALALTATCEAPGCNVAARVCQRDHAVPWTPTSPDARRGPTNVANVGPNCGRHNVNKERAGWKATRTADGVRRWVHERSGLRVTHLPDRWHPGKDPPPTTSRDPDPPPRPEPPPGRDDPAAGRDASPQDPPPTGDDTTVGELLDPPDPDIPF